MKTRLLLFLLFFFSICYGEQLFLIQDCVNAITGECTTEHEDLRIEAVEPLIVKRTYVNGAWNFLPHSILKMSGITSKKGYIYYPWAFVSEPCGILMSYQRTQEDQNHYVIDWNKTNRGHLAFQQKGFAAQRLVRTSTSGMTLYAVDGTMREYKWAYSEGASAYYILTCEVLPNGCARLYDYDKYYRLIGIKTVDSSREKTFAWCQLHYFKKPSEGNDFDLQASDGRILHYRFKELGKQKERYLTEVSGAASEHIQYTKLEKTLPPLLKQAKGSIEYYVPGKTNSIDGGAQIKLPDIDPRGGLVRMLHTDEGTYSFFYYPGYTEIKDGKDNWTIMRFAEGAFPARIEYCDAHKNPVRILELKWGSNAELLEKRSLTSSGGLQKLEEYVYDQEGNLIEERTTGDLCGQGKIQTATIRRIYGPGHMLQRLEEPNGISTEYEYLSGTHLVTAQFSIADGQVFKRSFFEYSPSKLLSKQIQDDGITREKDNLSGVNVRTLQTFEREQRGLPLYIESLAWDEGQEVLLKKTHFLYSEAGQLVEKHIFDPYGELRKVERTKEAPSPSSQVKKNGIYTIDGLLELESEPNGIQIKYDYNSQRRLSSIKRFSPDGDLLSQEFFSYRGALLVSHTDATGIVTTYSHDAAGRLISEEVVTPSGTESLLYSYDALDLITSITHGELVEQIAYDLLDRPIERRMESKNGDLLAQTTYRYDEKGHLIEETRWLSSGSMTVKREYDDKGRLVRQIEPDGQWMTQEFDGQGNLLCKQEFSPEGKCLRWEKRGYDASFRCILLQNQKGSTSFSYDEQGRLSTQENEEGKVRVEGNCTYTKLTNDVEIVRTYDLLGQLIEIQSSDQSIHQRLSYNGRGQLVDAEDCLSKTHLRRAYDAKGRLISETLPTGVKMRFEYDLSGRKKRILLPDHSSIVYRYTHGRLKEVARLDTSEKALYKQGFLDYDLSGFPKTQLLIEGLGKVHYTLDKNGQVEQISSPFGELSEGHKIISSKTQQSGSYYDALGRLVHFETDDVKIDWTYDLQGRCMMKRITTLAYGEWQLSSCLIFLYDDEIEIGAIDEKGMLKQLKVRAPIQVNSGDNSLVFELDGRAYIPLCDPAGNVRKLISAGRRYVIESYNYDSSGRCEILNEWGDPIPSSTVGNPWRIGCSRIEE